jgi:hypothetical protein
MFYIGEENYNINTRFKEQNVFYLCNVEALTNLTDKW